MKLITYVRMGKVCFGAVKGSGIIDLTGRIDLNVNSIKDLLKLDLLTNVKEYIKNREPEIPISEITFLPVIPNPDKIFLCWVELSRA